MDDLDPDVKRKGAGCCGCVFFITVLVLFILSFKVQNEQDICFQYNTVSKVVETSPTTNPGTKFLGFWNDILCYPKTVQRFEFAASNGESLNTRTIEGLSIGIDISVEYKFEIGKLYDLFNIFGASPTPAGAAEDVYKRISLSSIINTASKYPANSFLSEDRTNITTTMTANVNAALKKFHANVVSLQMRNIRLEQLFVDAIDNILSEKIMQEKLLKQKQTQLADAIRNRDILLQNYRQQRQDSIINADNTLALERAKKDKQLIIILQDYNKEVERAGSDRVNMLLEVKGKYADTVISRTGALQRARNSAAATKIKMQDLHSIEVAAAEVKGLEAMTTAYKTEQEGEAESQATSLAKSAEAEHFKVLNENVGMSKEDIVRHEFLNSLEEQKDAKLFVGYKKVSMLTESQKVRPVLKNIVP